jgi:hypothetical protein
MNEFIHDALNYDELDEFEDTILNLHTFKDFLNRINVTYGCYQDTEKYCVFIKCKGNSYTLFVVFDSNDKFESICKSYHKKDNAFETWAGRVLLHHFNPVQGVHCSDLNIHWGKHVIDLGDEKEK